MTLEERLAEIAKLAEHTANWLLAAWGLALFLLGILVGLWICGP